MTACALGMSSIKYGAEWAPPVTNRPVFDLFLHARSVPTATLRAAGVSSVFVRGTPKIIALIMLIDLPRAHVHDDALDSGVPPHGALRDVFLGPARSHRGRGRAQSRQHTSQMSTIIAHELAVPGAITNYGNGF